MAAINYKTYAHTSTDMMGNTAGYWHVTIKGKMAMLST